MAKADMPGQNGQLPPGLQMLIGRLGLAAGGPLKQQLGQNNPMAGNGPMPLGLGGAVASSVNPGTTSGMPLPGTPMPPTGPYNIPDMGRVMGPSMGGGPDNGLPMPMMPGGVGGAMPPKGLGGTAAGQMPQNPMAPNQELIKRLTAGRR